MKHATSLTLTALVTGAVLVPSIYAATDTSTSTGIISKFKNTFSHERTKDASGATRDANGPRGERGMGMGMMNKNITRTVTKLDNGATETLTTTDSGALARLNAMADRMNSVVRTVAKTENGATFTATSTDATVAARLREGIIMGGMPMGGMMKPPHEAESGATASSGSTVAAGTTFATSSEALDNGIRVTVSSNSADIIAKIQARADKENLVVTTVTKVANGITITRTSTDAATVTKLQAGEPIGGGEGFGMMDSKGPGSESNERGPRGGKGHGRDADDMNKNKSQSQDAPASTTL